MEDCGDGLYGSHGGGVLLKQSGVNNLRTNKKTYSRSWLKYKLYKVVQIKDEWKHKGK